MSKLFTPLALRGLTLANRIVVSPMCQYSAEDGSATDWHMIHLGQLSLSGAGLLTLEATGVEPEGRISPGCLGLYSDENEAALGRVLQACRRYGNTAIGIQLGHAGRKGSAKLQWLGAGPLKAEEGAWETVAPSALGFDDSWPKPRALARAELSRIKDAFVHATRRAERLGIDLIEVHAAHGYLFHQFVSPISNQRSDEFGGNQENCMRFPLEVIGAMREVWPAHKPLGVRMTGRDWRPDGLDVENGIVFANRLKALGCDYVCVSSGGVVQKLTIPLGPGYQASLSAQVRRATGLPTQTVGLIADPNQAEAIVAGGEADMVAIARGFLDDPRWAWHAAEALGASATYPPQYLRARPSVWPGAEIARPATAAVRAKAS